MKAIIIEDEKAAQKRILGLIQDLRPDWEITDFSDTVKKSIEILSKSEIPDLIFCDIQLADGLSFEIFEFVDVKSPVIFTTAYDEFAIKAFKTNSVDYLLKPIDREELEKSIIKFETIYHNQNAQIPKTDLITILKKFESKNFRNRYLIKIGEKLFSINVEEINYIFSQDKTNYLKIENRQNLIIERSLDQIEADLDPDKFFRLNRSFIISYDSVKDIIQYSNSRLKIRLKDDREEIVSRERVRDFKNWLDK